MRIGEKYILISAILALSVQMPDSSAQLFRKKEGFARSVREVENASKGAGGNSAGNQDGKSTLKAGGNPAGKTTANQARKDEMPPRNARNKEYLEYFVEDGDTIYYDVINPSKVWSVRNRKGKAWRRYYRLVWNFNKVYPYSKMAQRTIVRTDSLFDARHMSRWQKDRYINQMQENLFKDFDKTLREMTVSQGQLLMKLIDREVGKSSFHIIKEYKNGIAAGFWQGVAKFFGSDLKKPYAPEGEDRDVEELIKIWESGDFPDLYFSIFGEYPKATYIPERYR